MSWIARTLSWALIGAIGPTSLVAQSAPSQAAGVWQSEGYGLLVEIDSARLRAFQTTSISCMPWWTARRSDRPHQDGLVFDRGDAEVLATDSELPDVMILRDGTSSGRMTFHRVASLPITCADRLSDNPVNNYAVFWQTFAEQFVLFEQYRADWKAVDQRYRPRVTATTSPEQLYDLLREMILPFHSAHTTIAAPSIHRQYVGYRPVSEIGRWVNATTSISLDSMLARFTELGGRADAVVESRYAQGALRPLINGALHFGMLGGIGERLGTTTYDKIQVLSD